MSARGADDSKASRQPYRERDLSAIEEGEERNSGSMFASRQTNDQSGFIGEALSPVGVSESTIHYSEMESFSASDIREFSPFPTE